MKFDHAAEQSCSALRILNVAQSDREGGAARATYRLHRAFCDAGMQSVLYTPRKSIDDPTVHRTRNNPILAQVISFLNSRIPELYPKGSVRSFSPVRLGYGRLDSRAVQSADVVCLHWIAGAFLKPSELTRIRRPVVWQLWDCWPFTGGCHYPGDCNNYESMCGSCPILDSHKEYDLARLDFNARRRAYAALNITPVAPSRWLADKARRSSLFGGRRIEYIPSGVNLQIFRPHEKAMAREILGLPKDRQIVLFGAAGVTSDRRKGYHLLPEVFASFARSSAAGDVTLAVFGGQLTSPEASLGIPTLHLGRYEDDVSLALLYSAADILVAPYIEDNLPFVILEALACGTPVAAFAAGGIPDAVDHQRNGFLAPVRDATELGRGIAWLLSDPSRLYELGCEARNTAKARFDIVNCARTYEALFVDVVARYQSAEFGRPIG